MMKYYIITYGCQMNKSDSERIAAILESAGISAASCKEKTDLLIINSCSVRQSAINRIYGQIRNFRQRPGLCKTVLTGCILETDKKKFKDKFDLIIDIKELTKNPEKLLELLNFNKEEFRAFDYTDYFKINPQYRSDFSAYIPIMTGCNNFCSYCAVPYTRGREISRSAEEIIMEVKRLVKKGYKEITLLGQNVNSYSSKITNDKFSMTNQCQNPNVKKNTGESLVNFPQLLKMINNIPGDFWIRFLTSHSKDMSDELIETMAKCEKVCEYIHLPIQSGDDEILRKMNRRYTAKHYLELTEKIKNAYNSVDLEVRPPSQLGGRTSKWPPVAISTDIIVGFPDETKKQFENTAKIMRKVKFDMAYLAEYSPRPGTSAAKLEDDVPILEKKRRKRYLNKILKKTALANNKKYVGKIIEVLIEKVENGFALGKTRTFKNVRITFPRTVLGSFQGLSLETGHNQASPAVASTKAGQFAKIKITKANAWGLGGKYANIK